MINMLKALTDEANRRQEQMGSVNKDPKKGSKGNAGDKNWQK